MKKAFKSILKTKKHITAEKLIRLNFIAGTLHFIQGLIMLVVSKSSTLPITTNYLIFDESTQSLVSATRHLFDFPLVYLPVLFLFMSAIAHFVIIGVYRKQYVKDLSIGLNKARWMEYSFSASIMMVAIAMLSGMFDVSSLLMLATLTSAMNLMGLVMELWNQKSKSVNWLAYWLGCLFGIVPWIAVVIYFVGASVYGSGVPSFVYWIYVSIFVFFNSFAINMWLQYKKKGKWVDYLYGERAYIILSLVAKAVLAWQVWAGTLRS